MSPPQLSQPRQGPTVAEVDRGNVFQQSVQQIQDQYEKLVVENQQLKSQLQDQTEVKAELSWLEKTDKEHRRIVGKFSWLIRRHPGPLSHRQSFSTFMISSYTLESGASPSCGLWRKLEEEAWLRWVDKELGFGRETREGKWKEKITQLEGQIEQQRQELQATTTSSNATVADLKRKNQDLRAQQAAHKQDVASLKSQIEQQRHNMQASIDTAGAKTTKLQDQIHDMESAEKYCHHVINHLDNLRHAHPMANKASTTITSTSGPTNGIDTSRSTSNTASSISSSTTAPTPLTSAPTPSSCEGMSAAAAKEIVAWMGDADESLRFAQDMHSTFERSRKRRRTSSGYSAGVLHTVDAARDTRNSQQTPGAAHTADVQTAPTTGHVSASPTVRSASAAPSTGLGEAAAVETQCEAGFLMEGETASMQEGSMVRGRKGLWQRLEKTMNEQRCLRAMRRDLASTGGKNGRGRAV